MTAPQSLAALTRKTQHAARTNRTHPKPAPRRAARCEHVEASGSGSGALACRKRPCYGTPGSMTAVRCAQVNASARRVSTCLDASRLWRRDLPACLTYLHANAWYGQHRFEGDVDLVNAVCQYRDVSFSCSKTAAFGGVYAHVRLAVVRMHDHVRPAVTVTRTLCTHLFLTRAHEQRPSTHQLVRCGSGGLSRSKIVFV